MPVYIAIFSYVKLNFNLFKEAKESITLSIIISFIGKQSTIVPDRFAETTIKYH